jgi:predicted nucleotidyltransferase
MLDTLLTPHQRTIMERAIAEEEAKRRHLVIALSGAHAYGFPSPDSDLDLKAIHVDPTATLLDLGHGTPHADRMETIEGVEIDYTSNELKPVLIGVLASNGNYIERVLGALQPLRAPELDALAPLVERTLSRRIYRHYLGFATSQLNAAKSPEGTSAKKLLYVLRTALTGAHALRTGRVVIDLRELAPDYGFADARELIEAKRAGETIKLSEAAAARWIEDVKRAFGVLEAAHDRSPLPAEPEGVRELEAWLLAERQSRL